MLHAFLGQSILHALVAMLVTEALLRAWRIDQAAWRLRFHLLPIAAPLLLLPLFFVAAPWRLDPLFAESRALFSGDRWNLLAIGALRLGDLGLLLGCALGSALFLRDALPPIRDLLSPSRRAVARRPELAVPAAVDATVRRYCADLELPVPVIRVLPTRLPVLMCEGWPSALVISAGTLERLPDAALDAALAHELAHIRHRDPAIGYALIAVRALLFYNPAVQWAARAIVDDLERRADEEATRLTGRSDGLETAILAIFGAAPPPGEGSASFEWTFWRIRRAGMQRRCRRLRDAGHLVPLERPMLRWMLAMVGVGMLAWFVV